MILHHLKIPKHMISIVYTGALGLPNCPVDHCLFFWDRVASRALDECKWCLQRSIPTKERYSCAKLYGIPTGSISLHCVSVHWPRGIPWECSDSSLCSLSRYWVNPALFFLTTTWLLYLPVRHSPPFFPQLPQAHAATHSVQISSISPQGQQENYGEISLRKHSALGNEPFCVCNIEREWKKKTYAGDDYGQLWLT